MPTRIRVLPRAGTAALITLATTAATVGVAAVPAAAEPNPPGCPRGHVCAYSGNGQSGSLVFKSVGDWRGSAAARSVFNNGKRHPGADHIQLTWTYNGRTWSRCLHYNPYPGQPDPGEYKIDFVDGVVIKSATWRGECPARSADATPGSGVKR
ncbi:peptidase inhibitor family I36 protein [Actinomadura sp. 7K507]|uniref:peptidase inhibitor family I36 protein n=1 Tax=Actinomadura sp. 7K507 TaxID=2530365 RepID=UPI0010459828|nr:peptidase inhibitor family I36 protein [Actinomadura sp. 7K507]TDC93565.1 hypothetical protein E1285_10010 [Actinomadura sp. 7K507]